MTRVVKGSKRIMIEDYSTPHAGDKETRPKTRATKAPSVSQAMTTQTPTRHDNRDGQHQGSQRLEVNTTMATTWQTAGGRDSDAERENIDIGALKTRQDGASVF